ncbi:MAG: di-trans,poly-cis-decaprenylcistransferase [Chloroflexi bacterium]|nr:di-trans,poly-cis-decaprenylcistransferase [Chloroflexota bacterium]|tara:strand:+ start:720 stop:1439 length:720 start_codon:yes stop_codon:yes gene_type:complete
MKDSKDGKISDSLIIPNHVAIIMDGNGRWAESKNLDVSDGHVAGYKNIRQVIIIMKNMGVKYITLYAFSTENWNRPKNEVDSLIELAVSVINDETRELNNNNVKIQHLGRTDRMKTSLVKKIKKAIDITKNNTGITLSIAFDYGGRDEIINATNMIIGKNTQEDIDQDIFNQCLYSSNLPDVDFLIRTGGEYRISNFLLWKIAYSELYFTPIFWPDFSEEEIKLSFTEYSTRQRRFGKR